MNHRVSGTVGEDYALTFEGEEEDGERPAFHKESCASTSADDCSCRIFIEKPGVQHQKLSEGDHCSTVRVNYSRTTSPEINEKANKMSVSNLISKPESKRCFLQKLSSEHLFNRDSSQCALHSKIVPYEREYAKLTRSCSDANIGPHDIAHKACLPNITFLTPDTPITSSSPRPFAQRRCEGVQRLTAVYSPRLQNEGHVRRPSGSSSRSNDQSDVLDADYDADQDIHRDLSLSMNGRSEHEHMHSNIPLQLGNEPKAKRPWTEQEDSLLRSLVEQLGKGLWAAIAAQIPGRSGKQVRERWLNHLSPNVTKRPWSSEEDDIIIDSHHQFGNCWSRIAKLLEGRSDNSVKNRYYTTLRRRISASRSFTKLPSSGFIQPSHETNAKKRNAGSALPQPSEQVEMVNRQYKQPRVWE